VRPATTGLDDAIPWLKLQFTANIVQLGLLRFGERRGRRRIIGARIHQLGVQPQLVEIVPQIVVAMNVMAGAVQTIRLAPAHQV